MRRPIARAVGVLGVLLAPAAPLACASLLGIQDITDDAADAGSEANRDGVAPDAGEAASSDAPAGDGCGSSSDPLNCGQCGHTCLGGQCQGGLCQPTTLATSPGAHGITADETYAFWTVHTGAGAVMSALVDGSGAPKTLANGQDNPLDIAVSGPTVYWTQSTSAGGTELWSIGIPNGSVATKLLSYSGVAPNGLTAAPNGWIYFTSHNAAVSPGVYTPHAFTPDGGIDYPSTPGQVGGMASDSKDVFFTDLAHGYVLELPISTTASSIIVSGQSTPLAIARDSSRLYWVIPAAGLMQGAIASVVPGGDGGGAITPLASGLINPQGVATDGTNVYWTDATDNAVYRMPVGGGARQTVAMGQASPDAIALDSKRIFWVNDSNGTVMALAK